MSAPDSLADLLFWHWWILGLVLLIAEMFAPGFFFIWFAAAAGVVGLALALFPDLPWQAQWLAFGIISVAAVGATRAWQRRHPPASDEPTLNRRADRYVGRLATVTTPFVAGQGRIHLDDTDWMAVSTRGEDLATGTRVRVVSLSGTTVYVEAADVAEDDVPRNGSLGNPPHGG